MSESSSKYIVEISGNCTKDEAVALLLGWSGDPKRSAYVNVDLFGIKEEQFRTLPSMGESVSEILTQQLNDAEDMRQHAEFIIEQAKIPRTLPDAFKSSEAERASNRKDAVLEAEKLAEKAQEKIAHCKQMIVQADRFLRDIVMELALGKGSVLEHATPDDIEDKRILITKDSLDRWALRKYKFSIRTGSPLSERPLFDDDSAELQDFGPKRVKNLLTTLALMVDLLASLGQPYSKGDHDGNHGDSDFNSAILNAIGKSIEGRAQLHFGKGSIDGQDSQTIRKLLALAVAEFKEKLK